MAYTIIEDATKHSGSAGVDSRGLVFQDRVFVVDGYSYGISAAWALNVMDASDATLTADPGSTTLIPARNSPHPASLWAHLQLLSKAVEIIGYKQFVVTCRYGIPDASEVEPGTDPSAAIISVSSTLVESETSFDVNGDEIFTSHFTDTDSNPREVRGSVSDHAVTMVVRYERLELGSPGGNALTHVGRLNSDNLIFGVDGPRTWLCSEISGTSSDSGATYRVVYEFIRSPKVLKVGLANVVQPWDVEIVEIDPDTGTFVKDAVSDRGKKVIKIKGEAAFVSLNLTFAPAA